jgi:YVTN family beta-propeller protein
MKCASVLLVITCLLSAVKAQWLETTIQLPDSSGPWALCHNPQNNMVYSANRDSDNVTVIDGATNQVITTVTAGTYPYALCYNPQNNKVYCANLSSGNVTVIDGATNQVITTVTAGRVPYALCYNPQNNKVFCANVGSRYVTVIDGASNQVLRTIGVGDGPCDFTWNPAQNRVYVANLSSSNISVLRDSGGGVEESPQPQASSSKPTATVVRGLPPGAVAFDAMGRRVVSTKPGVYFVAVSGERSAVHVRKVVVQR